MSTMYFNIERNDNFFKFITEVIDFLGEIHQIFRKL